MKCVIIHYQPIEHYPPILNLIDVINNVPNQKNFVFTTRHSTRDIAFKNDLESVRIVRLPSVNKGSNVINRSLTYLYFYLYTFLYLLFCAPRVIIYYESISALPAVLYFALIRHWKKIRLYAHYHEYTSLEQYAQDMKISRWAHMLEQKYYSQYKWISHTNEIRLKQFALDNNLNGMNNLFIMPNYPPSTWFIPGRLKIELPVKVVYIGSLDTEDMYLENFVDWVESHNGKVLFDIYAYNFKNSVIEFFDLIQPTYTKLKKGIDYTSIPTVLHKYDVGVILYKGHTFNVKNCAPNKLFEYLTCGLDVWFSDELVGSYPYIIDHAIPKVTKVDSKALYKFNLNRAIQRSSLRENKTAYFAEDAYANLLKHIN